MTTSTTLQIFDIGFSMRIDGPGQRMVVYTKGCNLACPWCAAPESISRQPQVLFYPTRLSDPTRTIDACPYQAVSLRDNLVSRDVQRCATCADFVCTAQGNPAFQQVGECVPVTDLIARALRYRAHFGQDGGVTVGGGEPTCQFHAVQALLAGLHDAGVHTAMETNGTHPRLQELFPLLDLLYIDCKHPDDAACARITGVGNAQGFANMRARMAQGGVMIVRIPLVPGYNADDACLHDFGKQLSAIGPLTVEVLPFHKRGAMKWQALGQSMPAEYSPVPSTEEIATACDILRSYGLQVL